MNSTVGMDKFITVHVDLDGVMADFDKFVIEKMGKRFHPNQDKQMWEFLHGIPNFYYHLQPMADAMELWYEVNSMFTNVQILTAIPRRTTMPTAEEDKRSWVKKYLGEDVIVNIGPYSRDKWKHCTQPNDILIDDRKDNIEDWIKKGKGVGILHKNAADTIKQLTAHYIEMSK